MIGRTPDHVAGYFAGYAAVPEVFAAGGQQYATNVVNFYEHLRENHQWATYAIVPPQIDRSKPGHKQIDPTLYAGVVKEKDGGIIVAGAQQLATAGTFSDYIYLSCIHPMQPGDENYAIGVAIPMNAPGLKLYPRRPFALQTENRSTIRCRRVSTRPIASSCSITCSFPGSTSSSIATSKSAAISGGRRPRTPMATCRRRPVTRPSCDS